MKNKILLITAIMVIITTILVISVSAISCSPNPISISYNNTNSYQTILTCSNPTNQSIIITPSGETTSFSINTNTIQPNSSSQQITLTFNSGLSSGNHYGFLSFSDGSNIIPITFNVVEPITYSDIIVFPTAKVVSILNGQTKNQNIQVIVPIDYGDYINIQSITFNPDIDLVQTSDLDLGRLNSGQTLNIPLIINKDGLNNIQIGNYQTTMNILATNSHGIVNLPPVSIQVSVSASTNPLTNSSLVRPSCILSATNIPINSTATLTCSNVLNNLDVSPQYNEFINGVNAQLSAGIYVYSFTPTKIGSSSLTTQFNYLNSPIFSPSSGAYLTAKIDTGTTTIAKAAPAVATLIAPTNKAQTAPAIFPVACLNILLFFVNAKDISNILLNSLLIYVVASSILLYFFIAYITEALNNSL